MDNFRILSIDFDFFQDMTMEQLSHYPDGIDLPAEISNLVWSFHMNETEGVTLNKPFFRQLTAILKKQPSNIPVLITNSHKHVYDFIKTNHNSKNVEIYNIDLHHDVVNENSKLDCGNWISHAIKDFPVVKTEWIAHDLSLQMYDIEDIVEEINIKFDFSDIENRQFDAVFLCRSDNWLRPNLDKHFDRLIRILHHKFKNVVAETTILRHRQCKAYNMEESMLEQIQQKENNENE